MTTIYEDERHTAMSYWPFIAKCPMIKIISQLPKPNYEVENWKWLDKAHTIRIDLTKVDYAYNIKNGHYDTGNAIILGKTLDQKYYCICIGRQ